jgi:hypothetical protein
MKEDKMSEDFDFNIDLNTVEDTGGSFEPMPEGLYELQAESFEQKISKNKNTYISVQYRVTGENYNNRVVWENFTVTGANPTVAISRIKAWYIATGRGPDELNLTRESLAEMMGQGFLAKIGIEKSEQYGDKNKIDSFLAPKMTQAMPRTETVAESTPTQDLPTATGNAMDMWD